jgi:peptide/nickel transport system substrate-binding protein
MLLSADAASWTTLDPLKGTVEDWDIFNAIYGGLFEPGPNGAPVPDLAIGYKVTGKGTTVAIFLRKGVRFQDGTPFDASAVAYNLRRDLNPKNACFCIQDFPVASITTPNSSTVVLHLTHSYSPIINAFLDNTPDWIVSPTALQKMGQTRFGLHPVGAGPFEVVSNQPGTSLKLRRNPHYWQAGHPYLDALTFLLTPTDESAYVDLQANSGQAYGCMQTPSIVAQARTRYQVEPISPSCNGFMVIQLNTKKPPFNNILAREALYYATDAQAINQSLYGGTATVEQTVAGPGELFAQRTISGYRTYDLEKAQALVKRLGGLTFTIDTESAPIATELQTEWAGAGVKVTISNPPSLLAAIQLYHAGTWQAYVTPEGSYDPGAGTGLVFRYGSQSPFTGVANPTLDHLLAEGASTWSNGARARIYHQVFALINKEAYSPVLFSIPSYNVADRNITGPGLSSASSEIQWQDVAVASTRGGSRGLRPDLRRRPHRPSVPAGGPVDVPDPGRASRTGAARRRGEGWDPRLGVRRPPLGRLGGGRADGRGAEAPVPHGPRARRGLRAGSPPAHDPRAAPRRHDS